MITGGAWNFHDLNLSWFEHSFYAYIFKAYMTRSKQAKKKKKELIQLNCTSPKNPQAEEN